jgi:hypothetical protein
MCIDGVKTEVLCRYVLQVLVIADLVYFCDVVIIDRDSMAMTHIYICNKH